MKQPRAAAKQFANPRRKTARADRAPSVTRSRMRVPPRLVKDLDYVLLSSGRIATRLRVLSKEIAREFAGRDLTVIAILNGTVLFLADLIRQLNMPLRLDFIGVSSYGAGTTSGDLVYTKDLRLEVKGRDVLLVDDILDTGRTLKRVLERVQKLGPRRVLTCVLLDKPDRRIEKLAADFVGFAIPDLFVVGYGLDYAERYRNLPFIGVLQSSLYQ